MKRLFLSLALGLFMLLGTIGSLPEAKAGPAYQFELTTAAITGPVTLVPEQTVLVTATGFAPNERAAIYFQPAGTAAPGNRRTAVNETANVNGQLAITVTIPSGSPQGSVTMRAINAAGTVSSTYAATLNPLVKLSAARGAAGTRINVQGLSFATSEAFTVTFTNVATGTVGQDCIGSGHTVSRTLQSGSSTNSIGGFSFEATIPSVAAGTYQVVAVGTTSAVCTTGS
jgi:hypothetical protein